MKSTPLEKHAHIYKNVQYNTLIGLKDAHINIYKNVQYSTLIGSKESKVSPVKIKTQSQNRLK